MNWTGVDYLTMVKIFFFCSTKCLFILHLAKRIITCDYHIVPGVVWGRQTNGNLSATCVSVKCLGWDFYCAG